MALMFQSTSRLVLCFQWFIEDFHTYSRLPIIRTFKGNRKKFELAGVPVIEGNYMEHDLKGNENYFELTGGSSYRGFELSYRESTVLCILYFS